jgi:hypothetical protein
LAIEEGVCPLVGECCGLGVVMLAATAGVAGGQIRPSPIKAKRTGALFRVTGSTLSSNLWREIAARKTHPPGPEAAEVSLSIESKADCPRSRKRSALEIQVLSSKGQFLDCQLKGGMNSYGTTIIKRQSSKAY